MDTYKLGPIAKLNYKDGTFDMISPGTHVICAVTGKHILLDRLRYWSVARQEAYIDAAASLQAHQQHTQKQNDKED